MDNFMHYILPALIGVLLAAVCSSGGPKFIRRKYRCLVCALCAVGIAVGAAYLWNTYKDSTPPTGFTQGVDHAP